MFPPWTFYAMGKDALRPQGHEVPCSSWNSDAVVCWWCRRGLQEGTQAGGRSPSVGSVPV